MSVSKKILNESHIALLDNGQMALVDNTRNGNLRIHRYITREEIVNIIRAFYIQYKHDTGKEVMQLPFGDDTILALAVIKAPEGQNEQQ